MLNKIQDVQESDTTKDQSSNAAKYIQNFRTQNTELTEKFLQSKFPHRLRLRQAFGDRSGTGATF